MERRRSTIYETSGIDWGERILKLLEATEDPFAQQVELFGQEGAKAQIEPFLDSEIPNILMLGEPGIGKTHMARWIAAQKRAYFIESLCPVEPTDAPATGVWLLDECHRQSKPEPLFRIMESGLICVIGATTRPDKLDPAFRSRFFIQVYLEPLNEKARKDYMAYLLGDIPEADLEILAAASAGNPRQAQRIAATAEALESTDPAEVLEACRINADGLGELHLKIMKALNRTSRGTGLNTLALMVRSDEGTVADHEMFLLDMGLIELTPTGRKLTAKGRDYAGLLA